MGLLHPILGVIAGTHSPDYFHPYFPSIDYRVGINFCNLQRYDEACSFAVSFRVRFPGISAALLNNRDVLIFLRLFDVSSRGVVS